MTWWLLLLVPAAALAYLGLGVWKIGRVSRGVPTGPLGGGTALLLIDLQTVFWDGGA